MEKKSHVTTRSLPVYQISAYFFVDPEKMFAIKFDVFNHWYKETRIEKIMKLGMHPTIQFIPDLTINYLSDIPHNRFR